MPEIGKHTLSHWMIDYDLFRSDFGKFVIDYFAILNIDARIDEHRLLMLHTQWAGDCEHFRVYEFKTPPKELSHIKVMGLLVGCFARNKLFDCFTVADPSLESDDHIARREDFLGAPEAILALDFAFCVIEWFEVERPDRKTDYIFRLTAKLRNDIIRFIRQNGSDKAAIILILASLFSRP